ncbi:Protein of unknown function [Gryllus bimaculatus]|nr:Protein of unknown function [Gryllus bimaculatus]
MVTELLIMTQLINKQWNEELRKKMYYIDLFYFATLRIIQFRVSWTYLNFSNKSEFNYCI